LKLLARTAANLILLVPEALGSANLDWQAAENVPFTIRSGVEVARHAAGQTPARLSFVCSAQGSLHLLLRTRLPIPEAYRRNIVGRVDGVAVFVGEGIKKQLRIVVDVVATGRNHVEKVEEWLIGIDAPDTIITPPLSATQVATLEGWFGSVPPAKVSIVGVWETGVFMVATRAGDAIRILREGCTATPG
jgi:hypothetical protein